jgi:aminodeoxyfutalosine deaminase
MGYRKFKADQLFTGKSFAPEHSVLITRADGSIENIVPLQQAGEGVEEIDGTLTPGFINCHCHLELSHMQGLIPPGTGMVNFLLAVIQQRNTHHEKLLLSIAAAEQTMLNAGIVAVGDICNTADTLIQKKTQRLLYHNFIECSGFLPAVASGRFEAALAMQQQLAVTGKTTLAPHAPYSVSDALFQLISQSVHGQLSTMHNQESQAENDFFLTGSGDFGRLFGQLGMDISFYKPPQTTSLQAVWPWLQHLTKLILVHNTFINQHDLDFIQLTNTANRKLPELYFCLCPNANIYINNQLPPIDLLLKNNCRIVLGTDSLASNQQLSIYEEIKTIRRHFPLIPMQTLLTWATLNGAEALGIAEVFGSFEKGKKPGIVQIHRDSSHRLL